MYFRVTSEDMISKLAEVTGEDRGLGPPRDGGSGRFRGAPREVGLKGGRS